MARAVSNVWVVIQEWLDVVPFPPTQSKLAERLGLSRSAISDWKYGTTAPTPEHLLDLAEVMEPELGPEVYLRLVAALSADQGYLPARTGSARPDFEFTDASGRRIVLEMKAARRTPDGKPTPAQRRRRKLDQAGEESQDSSS